MIFRNVRILAIVPVLLSLSLTVSAEQNTRPPKLGLPLKCTLGQDCFIQHYIDTDPTKGSSDYTCGSLTYDNHRGTDIRIRTLADMSKGIPIIAAADGTVSALRNGVKDQYVSDYTKAKRKEIYQIGLGNVVILDHGNKWTTFYAHMKLDSLTVKKNQRVKKGDILGYVGMSGLTDFPHIHFELRHKNKRIDPFTGENPGAGCGTALKNYWDDVTRSALNYDPTGFLYTGLSETRSQGRKDLEKGDKKQQTLNQSAPTLFFWSYYFGSRKGDIVHLVLKSPNGKTLAEHTTKPMPKNQISRSYYVGKKKPAGGWPTGLYRGDITIERNGKLLKDSAVITVE